MQPGVPEFSVLFSGVQSLAIPKSVNLKYPLLSKTGFSGFTSGLRYFNSAIGVTQLQGIVSNGPNMKMKSENLIKSKPRYLSNRWFFEEAQDI